MRSAEAWHKGNDGVKAAHTQRAAHSAGVRRGGCEAEGSVFEGKWQYATQLGLTCVKAA